MEQILKRDWEYDAESVCLISLRWFSAENALRDSKKP